MDPGWADRTEEIQSFPAQYLVAGERVETGYQDGDVEEGMMPAGQASNWSTPPARRRLVREIVDEAEAILADGGS